MARMRAPAAKTPKLLLRSCDTRPYRPTAAVLAESWVRKMLAMRNSLTAPMKPSSPVTARIGATSGRMIPKKIWGGEAPGTGGSGGPERQDDPEEDLGVRGPVDLGRFVQVLGDGVEEALHEPGVHPQRPAHVQQEQAPHGVEPDRGPQVGDGREHQVEGDDGQELREHLYQQDREEPEPSALEPEARGRIDRAH